jgi:iron complex outermembrane receptor protein
MRLFSHSSPFLSRKASMLPSFLYGAVALAGMTGHAEAQDAQVEDVKITRETGELSPRKLEVLKIPRPIVVIDPKTLEQEHLMCLDDFALKLPNYRPNTGGLGAYPYNSLAAIRGVGIVAGAATDWGGESDTGFVLDNVFWKYAGFQRGNFIDLQSVEVALGPQGTTGGKNTTVGSIVIRTQLPSFTRQTTLETSFGNYDRITQKVSTTGPIIEDKLAYRISAYFDKGDGWIRDQATGADYLNTDQWGVKGQLLYVGDAVTDRLIFSYYASHAYDAYNQGPFADTFLIYANGTRPASTYAQNLARIGRPLLTLDPYKPYLSREGGSSARYLTVSNELNWNIGENVLTSISAYGFARDFGKFWTDGNQQLQLVGGAMDPYIEQFSQEVRLSSPKEQELEWVGGLYGFYEYIWNRMHHYDAGVDAAKWFNRPALLPGLRNNWDGKVRTFQIAAYGSATYHFDEQWSLTFGLRNSYEIKEGSNFSWQTLFPGPYSAAEQVAALRAAGGQGFFDTGGQSASHNFITAIVNPKHQLNENILVYGLFGYGEKAGAASTATRPIIDDKGNFKSQPPVIGKPAVSWDYEIGVKTNWLDGTLILNANLYWNDIYNFHAILADTTQANSLGDAIRVNYLGNVPHVRLRGAEFDGRWRPIERLWINFTGAYTEARYLDFANAPPPNDWLWPTPNPAPADFIRAPKALSRSNSRLEGLPWWSFNIGFNYDYPLGNALRDLGEWVDRPVTAFAYANASWFDKSQLTNPWSIFQYWQPAYAIVNAGVGLRADDNRYSLGLWVKNIADERPILSWSPGSASTPATVGIPTSPNFPRRFGATLLVKL